MIKDLTSTFQRWRILGWKRLNIMKFLLTIRFISFMGWRREKGLKTR